MPDTVFKGVVKIPYDTSLAAVERTAAAQPQRRCPWLMVADGFKARPEERRTENSKRKKLRRVPSPVQRRQPPTFLLVGPLPGDLHQEISSWPILCPIPARTATFTSVKIPCMWAENRAAGQVYPTGEKEQQHRLTTLQWLHRQCHPPLVMPALRW